MSAKLTDSRRFKNRKPGSAYFPKNKRQGAVYLLRYANAYDNAQKATAPKDFSLTPASF